MKKSIRICISLLGVVAFCSSCGNSDQPKVSAHWSGSVLNTGTQLVAAAPQLKSGGHFSTLAALGETAQWSTLKAVNPDAVASLDSNEGLNRVDAKASALSASSDSFPLQSLSQALAGDPAAVATANAYGSGGVASGPSVGTGTLQVNPSFYGGVSSTSTVGNDVLAKTICEFYSSFFSFFGRCLEGVVIDFSTIFGASGCQASISAALSSAGASSIPARAIAALECVSGQLSTVACTGTSDLSTPVFKALGACGFSFVAK